MHKYIIDILSILAAGTLLKFLLKGVKALTGYPVDPLDPETRRIWYQMTGSYPNESGSTY